VPARREGRHEDQDLSQPKRREPDANEPAIEATEAEKAVLRRYLDQARTPRLKIKEGKGIGTDHREGVIGHALLMDALGISSHDFYCGLLSQVVNAGSHGPQVEEGGPNFMLSVVEGIKPRDQLEIMLAAQMAATHMATMAFARRLAHVENIAQQDSAERAFNKLARTYAMQMEALKRYRSGGEQKVTVQNMSVSDGGQAIVGNVTQAPRENPVANPANSGPAMLTDARQPEMPILTGEPQRTPVERPRRKDGQSSYS
jgi:hypothetical protein